MIRFLAFLCLALSATSAHGEEIVAGLSQDQVSITANFDGSEILIFGAVSREAPIPEGSELDVIVTVAGPNLPVTVRRKARRFGIWVNTEAAVIDAAPTFYAVAATRQLSDVLSATDDLRHRITARRAIRAVDLGVNDPLAFSDAVLRIRQDAGLYAQLDAAVTLREQTLFDVAVALPANLVEGDYATRIFLVRDGDIVSQFQTEIAVRKVGLERLIYNLAHEQPLLYGILSLAIAIFAGWAASAFFQVIRR